jgi:hypothetical protein
MRSSMRVVAPPERECHPPPATRQKVVGPLTQHAAVKCSGGASAWRGQSTARSISRTMLMAPRPTHPSSPVSTASSAASAAASPRSDREGHREQERGQRRFLAPHFLHIAMASFSPCLRTARTRQALPARPPSAVRVRARVMSLSPHRPATEVAVAGPAHGRRGVTSHRRGAGRRCGVRRFPGASCAVHGVPSLRIPDG